MFYSDANEEAIRNRFNTLSLYMLVFCYLAAYYFLDRTFSQVWYGFPLSLFSYLLLRCLVHRKRLASAPYFCNNKSKFIKLFLWTALTNFGFLSLHYLAHYPILSQQFIPIDATMSSAIEYSGVDTDDIYWSLKFNLNSQAIAAREPSPSPLQDDSLSLYPSSDRNLQSLGETVVGCGCGVEYGPVGDIVFNPSMPHKYYENKFGVPGIKIPTWLCLCYSRGSCTRNYLEAEELSKTKKLYYKIVGDRDVALKNTVCPPPSMDFVQIYREEWGVPAHDSVFLNLLLGFSLSVSSLCLFVSFIFVHLTENYGNRITFVVLNSMATVGLEISLIVFEHFTDYPLTKFAPFMVTFIGSGYIFIFLLKGDLYKILKGIKDKFAAIFKDDGESRNVIMKVLIVIGRILWFVIGICWMVFNLIVVVWFKGRCKIFAMKEFKLTEEKYSVFYKKKELINKNKLLNILTLIDAVFFRCGEAGVLLYILLIEDVKNLLLVDVALGFISYEALSCIYPLVRQMIVMKSAKMMIESLHPRYFNVTVVRRERLLKKEEMSRVKKGDLDESLELRNRAEREIVINDR